MAKHIDTLRAVINAWRRLDIDGVPRNLTNTVFPFEYNNIKQLEEIINTKNIGTVKMEVERNIPPEEGTQNREGYEGNVDEGA